jgi:hypothetical protein
MPLTFLGSFRDTIRDTNTRKDMNKLTITLHYSKDAYVVFCNVVV